MATYKLQFTLILFTYFSPIFSEVDYNFASAYFSNFYSNIPGFSGSSHSHRQSVSYSPGDYRRIWDNTGLDKRLITLALITSEAQPLNLSPLKLTITRNTPLQVKNIGYAVRSIPINDSSALTMTEGIFSYDLYKLYIYTHHNDGSDRSPRCAYTENGIGTSLSYQLLFYNTRYGTLENALKYSNGTGLILFQILVGGEADENLDFRYYEAALQRVQQLNATDTINAGDALRWLLKPLLNCACYYGYPGAALDITTGALTLTAILLQIPLSCSPTISLNQFITHTRILNQNSQPTANILPSYPSNGRLIVKAKGIKVVGNF